MSMIRVENYFQKMHFSVLELANESLNSFMRVAILSYCTTWIKSQERPGKLLSTKAFLYFPQNNFCVFRD